MLIRAVGLVTMRLSATIPPMSPFNLCLAVPKARHLVPTQKLDAFDGELAFITGFEPRQEGRDLSLAECLDLTLD